ncbi:PIN domain-containing protein [soil metagenome]
MIVLDASAVAELLLDTEQGERVGRLVATPHESLHAPELLAAEIASVLRKFVLRGEMAVLVAQRAIGELQALGIETYPHLPFMSRVLDLRATVASYDAFYVALAEALNAALVTCDARLASTLGHQARIELIE